MELSICETNYFLPKAGIVGFKKSKVGKRKQKVLSLEMARNLEIKKTKNV